MFEMNVCVGEGSTKHHVEYHFLPEQCPFSTDVANTAKCVLVLLFLC